MGQDQEDHQQQSLVFLGRGRRQGERRRTGRYYGTVFLCQPCSQSRSLSCQLLLGPSLSESGPGLDPFSGGSSVRLFLSLGTNIIESDLTWSGGVGS